MRHNVDVKKVIMNRYPHQQKNVGRGSIVVHTSDPKAFLISQEKIQHLGGKPSIPHSVLNSEKLSKEEIENLKNKKP